VGLVHQIDYVLQEPRIMRIWETLWNGGLEGKFKNPFRSTVEDDILNPPLKNRIKIWI
jgi:hypothetical protein